MKRSSLQHKIKTQTNQLWTQNRIISCVKPQRLGFSIWDHQKIQGLTALVLAATKIHTLVRCQNFQLIYESIMKTHYHMNIKHIAVHRNIKPQKIIVITHEKQIKYINVRKFPKSAPEAANGFLLLYFSNQITVNRLPGCCRYNTTYSTKI